MEIKTILFENKCKLSNKVYQLSRMKAAKKIVQESKEIYYEKIIENVQQVSVKKIPKGQLNELNHLLDTYVVIDVAHPDSSDLNWASLKKYMKDEKIQ